MYGWYPYCILSYDTYGRPFWTFTRFKSLPEKSDAKPADKPGGGSYRIRVGKWEEVYDPLDGTKTWYSTVTKKTTKKDPFW